MDIDWAWLNYIIIGDEFSGGMGAFRSAFPGLICSVSSRCVMRFFSVVAAALMSCLHYEGGSWLVSELTHRTSRYFDGPVFLALLLAKRSFDLIFLLKIA